MEVNATPKEWSISILGGYVLTLFFVNFISLAMWWSISFPNKLNELKNIDVNIPEARSSVNNPLVDWDCIDNKIAVESFDLTDCEDDQLILDDSEPEHPNNIEEDTDKKNNYSMYVKQVYFGSPFAFIIFFMIASANAITMCAILNLNKNNGVLSKIDKFSSWTIDAPPIFGIVGTMFAMTSFFASNTDGGQPDFSNFFSDFSIAAFSTILGGLMAVVNHLAWSFIDLSKQ